jgi:hypothetical protein
MVDAEYLSPPDARRGLDWFQIAEALDAVEKGANVLGTDAAAGEGGGGRSEDIAAVEGIGRVRKPKLTICDFAGGEGGVIGEQQAEDAIIGSDEELLLEFDQQGFPGGADTGIDYYNVNCTGRKERGGLCDGISAGTERKRWNVVGDIQDSSIWTAA